MEIGDRFGSLVFTGNKGMRFLSSRGDRTVLEFQCDRGKKTFAESHSVIRGHKSSCGCARFREEVMARRRSKMVEKSDEYEYVKKYKPSKPGARLVSARHNPDATCRRVEQSIGSSMVMI